MKLVVKYDLQSEVGLTRFAERGYSFFNFDSFKSFNNGEVDQMENTNKIFIEIELITIIGLNLFLLENTAKPVQPTKYTTITSLYESGAFIVPILRERLKREVL